MIDPVTLAVVRGALGQIADEMDLHLIHAAISPIISETNDCAHGIFDPVTGETRNISNFIENQVTAELRQDATAAKLAWGLQFLAACNCAQVQRATREMLALSFLSRDTLAQWLAGAEADAPAAIRFRRNGKLVLCPDLA